MSISTLKCPGYAEGNSGRIIHMQRKYPEYVLLQEIGTDVRVKCHALVDGICTAGVGKIDQEKFVEKTEEQEGKQIPCYWLPEKE